MIVTFLHHSCFAIETGERTLIFDYFQNESVDGYNVTGKLPEISKEKPFYVFASHAHRDHYDPAILTWEEEYPKIRYILSKDIRIPRNRLKKQNATFVQPNKKYTVDDMTVLTLRSTDAGVAFLIHMEGKYIFHSGDLNLWKWEGAGDLVNGKEARDYKREIHKLADYVIDAAFVPLDPRQKKYTEEGMRYFMEHVNAKTIFPMHMWQDYSVIAAFKSKISNGLFANRLVEIEGENEAHTI